NGRKEGDEECDGTDFGDAACPTLTPLLVPRAGKGSAGGGLVCLPDCTIDFSGCPNVTTSTVSTTSTSTSTSTTESTSTSTETSTSTSSSSSESTSSTSTSTSTSTPTTEPPCPNGHLDPGEECDTDDFGTATCPDSTTSAFLKCTSD